MKCIGESTEKHITLSVKFQEDFDDEKVEEETKPKSYRLRFIDSFRFMSF